MIHLALIGVFLIPQIVFGDCVATVAPESGLVLRQEPSRDSANLALMPKGTVVTCAYTPPPVLAIIDGQSGYWISVKYKGKAGFAFSLFLEQLGPRVYLQNRNLYYVLKSTPVTHCAADNPYRNYGICTLLVYRNGKIIAELPWVYATRWIDETHLLAVKGDAHAGVAYSIIYSVDVSTGLEVTLGSTSLEMPFDFSGDPKTPAPNVLQVCRGADQQALCCSATSLGGHHKFYKGSDPKDPPLWELRMPGLLNPLLTISDFGFSINPGGKAQTTFSVDPVSCKRK